MNVNFPKSQKLKNCRELPDNENDCTALLTCDFHQEKLPIFKNLCELCI